MLAVACGGDSGNGNGNGDGNGSSDAGNDNGGDSCAAPDMMIILDRTMSMHRRPDGSVPTNDAAGHMESKWFIAISSLEAVTARLQASIRFGLTLFPRDPGNDICVTLTERISGMTASNTQCEAGETVVSSALSTATMIDDVLDPEATRLCTSTPIGAGIGTAITGLEATRVADRDQYALLLTDGRDTCEDALALSNAQALAAAGIDLYVIGFDGSGNGIDNGLLNDLACAGQTAAGFPAPCTDDGNGNFTATDRDGPALYSLAEGPDQLATVLQQVAEGICCGCVE